MNFLKKQKNDQRLNKNGLQSQQESNLKYNGLLMPLLKTENLTEMC